MRFEEPWAFLALLLVPAFGFAHWWMAQHRARRLATAGDPKLLEEMALISERASLIRTAQIVLTGLALAFVVIALARPQFGLKVDKRRARGMDVVIALDLSRSMLAQDVVPSRLARARIELSDLVDQLGGDRVGLLGFTSLPLPLCPLTVDRAALKLQLKAASPDDLPRGGTAIGLAIEEGLKMLKNARATGASQAIVVVTDGEEHEGDPESAAKKAAEAGVQVHVVGVGSRTGEPIPILDDKGRSKGYLKDRSRKTVVSRLNESMLRKIAEAGTGLVALPGAQGGIDLNPVRRHLGTLRRADLEDRVVRVYEERYQWFLVPAFILLVLASVLRPSKPRRRLVVSGLAALWLLAASPAQAAGPLESEDPDVVAGNAALAEGKAEEARQAYERARSRLGDRPEILFNQALADVARGELDQAITGFKTAGSSATDPALRGQAAFALGNTLRQLKKYDEALEAYKQALVAAPGLSGARRNYEITQRMKAIQDAQPKNEDPNGEPDENQDSPDGGPSDGGPSDGGSQGQGGDGGPPDAGTPGDGGSDNADGGGANTNDGGGPPPAGDGGTDTPDASGAPPPKPSEPEEPEEEVDRQQAEAILDALQDQEEALKRERLLKRFKGKAVEKDW